MVIKHDWFIKAELLAGCLGTALMIVQILERKPYDPLVHPYGFTGFVFVLCIHGCLYAITPSKWWR